MVMVLFNEAFEDLGTIHLDIDFEIGDVNSLNDFELTSSGIDAHGIYIPGTEWGGVFEYQQGQTRSDSQTIKGWNWRGLLTQGIIEPPAGSDYRIVSGEANNIIRELLESFLGGFFVVTETDSGLTINSYQFKLHTTFLEGLMDMLSEYGYRLKIYAQKTGTGGKIQVFLEAVPAVILEGEYNEDNGLDLIFTESQMGINHLICLGKGELQNRQRIDLYLQEDGSIGKDKYFDGFSERTAVYENSSAESLTDLEKYGQTRLKEISCKRSLDMKNVELEEEMEIGDIVSGRHRASGITIQKPIIKKILRVSDGIASIEYAVKGEG